VRRWGAALAAALTALAVAALVACRPRSGGAPVATNHVDLPPSYLFVPTAITVPAGTKVTWTNHDHFTHSVRLIDDGGPAMIMRPDSSVSFTFTTAGTHHYECSFHPRDMHGTVLVTNP
jgi:plastocyanin